MLHGACYGLLGRGVADGLLPPPLLHYWAGALHQPSAVRLCSRHSTCNRSPSRPCHTAPCPLPTQVHSLMIKKTSAVTTTVLGALRSRCAAAAGCAGRLVQLGKGASRGRHALLDTLNWAVLVSLLQGALVPEHACQKASPHVVCRRRRGQDCGPAAAVGHAAGRGQGVHPEDDRGVSCPLDD